MEIKNEKELQSKLDALGDMDEDTKKSVVCSLIGHSRIQDYCFGYYSCARCGQQLGDSLASFYPDAEKTVIVGHDCETCRTNAKSLTWKDTFMSPDPFKKQ